MANSFDTIRTKDIDALLENKQYRSLFVATATVLFVVLFLLFGILPAYSAILDQMAANGERDEAITEITKKLHTLKSFDTQYETKSDVIELFAKAYPSQDAVQEEVTQRMFELSEERSTPIAALSFSETNALFNEIGVNGVDSRVGHGLLQARIRGSRANLLNLIEDLEEEKFIFNFLNVNLVQLSESELEGSNLSGNYELRVGAQYFYWRGDTLFEAAN